MQTILQIIKRAGGWNPGLNLKIENLPYMALVIEATDESGPCGLPAISVCHYGEQNGDLMRDPEMCFELGLVGGAHLNPFYYRNDYVGVGEFDFLTEAATVFLPLQPRKEKKLKKPPTPIKKEPKKAAAKKKIAA